MTKKDDHADPASPDPNRTGQPLPCPVLQARRRHGRRPHPPGAPARRDGPPRRAGTAEWSDTSGTVTFTPWGQCTLTAGAGTLTLRIDAADEDGLAQIREIITRDFERFSRRDPLALTWQRSEVPDVAPFPHTRG